MRLSKRQRELLVKFGDERTIIHTRWVLANSMSRAGGDPNPRSYLALEDRRLIRCTDKKTTKENDNGTEKYVTIKTYVITEKGRKALVL